MATRATGGIRINGVATGEVAVSLLSPSIALRVTYSLCNVDSGEKFGRGTREGPWSEETIAALLHFLSCAETDICNDCFDESTAKPDAANSTSVSESALADESGIESL